jgi:uncharacterized short protein YbdD (DUF466 family)
MFHSFQAVEQSQQQNTQVPFIRHVVAQVIIQPMPTVPFVQLSWWGKIKFIGQQLAKSFRLMVGVQDYQNYVLHMQQHHPMQAVMTEKQFHRRCLEARFPSQGGKMGKCPC